MLKFQNFCWLAGQPSLPAPFSRAVGWKSKLRSQLFVCLVVPILKRCDTTPCPKTPGGDRFGRNPLLPDPKGPWVQVTRQKITCKELSGPWKFCARPSNESKVTAHFWGEGLSDLQTQRRTDKNQSPLYHYRTEFFFIHVRGKEGNTFFKAFIYRTFPNLYIVDNFDMK